MRILQESRAQQLQRYVQPELSGVLHTAGDIHAPEQAARGGDVGHDRQIQGCTWTGRNTGIGSHGFDQTPVIAGALEVAQ